MPRAATGRGRAGAGMVGLMACLAAVPALGQEVPASPDAGGPRLWEVTGLSTTLNLRESPSLSAPVLARFTPGQRLANMGCQKVEARVWCLVQPIGGGPVGHVAQDFLRPATGPDGAVARGEDDSALRAGEGRFDATGTVPCAEVAAQPMAQCGFGVARAGGGYATVVITRPGGAQRLIFFADGMAIGTDSSEAAPAGAFRAIKEGDLNRVFVGEERYEIPDAVVLAD